MVDLNTCPPTPPAGESSKIKNLMGRTPGIGMLKSKFLTVLGNSNELLNGISNKLTLSISSSDSEYCDDDEEVPDFDETIDYTKIDFESRRVKARRAHEEIVSGRFRHPNLAPRPRFLTSRSPTNGKNGTCSSSASSSISASSRAIGTNAADDSSITRSNSIESRDSGGYGRPGRAVAGARRSDLDIQKDLRRISDILNTGAPQIDIQPPSDRERLEQIKVGGRQTLLDNVTVAATTSVNSIRVPLHSKTSNSSTLTSLRDDPDVQVSPSVDSTDWRNFIRSESQNSVPSWASSISLDCRAGEEPIKEFMKEFTEVMFTDAPAIRLDLKSEFGEMVRSETGRQWFTRFLLEQKVKSARVEELTFYSLVQFLAIVLFECTEAEDYGPAMVIMNICFAFYHDIDVPGCEPYREYLFIFMRQQPIWHNLRFWNAAFFEMVQNEREHRLAMKMKSLERRKKRQASKMEATAGANITTEDTIKVHNEESSSSSSHHSNVMASSVSLAQSAFNEGVKDIKLMDSIVFRFLGTFTCNMHALGIRQELCLEFLKKQSATWNLSKDKIKLVRDNIQRMYQETELWGAKAL